MARPRVFDESEAVAAAGRLFRDRGYEGASVDDLVTALGVHRGSLYRTFGSKLALFHRALQACVDDELLPWIAASEALLADATGDSAPDPGLLLVAAVERPADPVVRAEVDRVRAALATASGVDGPAAEGLVAALLGLWVLARVGVPAATLADAARALAPTDHGAAHTTRRNS